MGIENFVSGVGLNVGQSATTSKQLNTIQQQKQTHM